MVWRIAKKELLLNLLTLRFAVGTILFLALAVLFTSVLLSDYRQKLEGYNKRVSMNSDELRRLMTYQNLKPTIYKPPELLALFSKGVEENMGNSARVSIGEVPMPTSSAATKNPLLSVFPLLDVVLIFKLVISVLAFLLAYDAISGEKEDGTLALTLSNSVPRHQVLFGKFIGGMITLAIPITVGFLMTSLILSLSPMVQLTGGIWGRIALMFFVSLIMVGVLFNLGLFFSSMTKRASDTLMLLLFLWVVFVLIIPNGSTYLAAQFKPIDSPEKVGLRQREIWDRFGKEVNDFSRKIYLPGNSIQSDASEPWGWYHRFATKNLILYKQKLNAFAEPKRIKYADEAWQADRDYLESLKRQKEMADFISRSSPISVYEMLISSLSRTDIFSFEEFSRQARVYRQQMIDYLYNHKAFSSIRYFATVKEEHLFDVQNISSEEYGILRKKYDSEEPSPLNVSDFPQFRYRPESAAETMKRILPDVALLCVMGVLFFLCAFVAFLRYDVR